MQKQQIDVEMIVQQHTDCQVCDASVLLPKSTAASGHDLRVEITWQTQLQLVTARWAKEERVRNSVTVVHERQVSDRTRAAAGAKKSESGGRQIPADHLAGLSSRSL